MTTAAATPPPAQPLDRFDRTERAVHWCTAVLGLTLLATGAALYAGPISTLVGRRDLVRTVHVLAGIILPVPVVIGLLLPRRGRAFRADVQELNRFDDDDRRWLRRRTHSRARPAKFNAGQKLNAAFLAAAGVVMFVTGLMLRFPERFAVDIRTGATFVHDWFAIGVALAVTGHIVFALRDSDALAGMWRGRVQAAWARRTHPRWYERVTGQRADRLAGSPDGNSSGRERAPR
ncbi:MAG: cytochrome b/b6 domain-containing protein [Acidimicrobiia bacterium]|jgi:formate dehydrogenase subunit gamma